MIGVDTNVLIRFIVEDDDQQTQRAAELLLDVENARRGFYVSHIALAELEWVLSSGYGFARREIHATLRDLLKTLALVFEDVDEVERALDAYAAGKADLSDYLLLEGAWTAGCERFVSFDKALATGGDARVQRA
jgi:predicted nucleic-acid-binding protein